MNSRERFHRIMRFEQPDRLPLVEWAVWWDKTIERWHSEGLPAGISDRYELYDYFGLEPYMQDWVPCIGPQATKPVAHGAGVLTGDDYEAEYEACLPHLFRLDESGPVDPQMWRRWGQLQESGEAVLWFTMEGFFWLPRELFGIEDHLYSFFDYPELMHRMNQDLADWMIRVIDRICEFAQPDFMTFAEDMSYNHGPMLSEQMFDEFMLPYYQQVIPHLKKKGIIAFIDSDGDVAQASPWFARAGIDGILPLERQAGVDLAAIRETCPEMRFIGHFDKMTMSRGEAAMRAEFERLLPLARQGGFILSCDHQTPPEVSLEQYQLYLKLFREYSPLI